MQNTISRSRPTESYHDDPPGPPARRSRSGRSGATRSAAATRKRRGDPLWARILVIVGALLMMVSGGVIAGGKLLFANLNDSVNQTDLLAGQGKASINGPINVLLVGLDERKDSPEAGIRADSIIIAHINAAHDQAYLVSIPRDSYVEIPPSPKSGFRGTNDKINSAFYFGSQNGQGRAGGFALLSQTIRGFTGIEFHGGAIINFEGFKAVVDAMGGIDMYVDDTVTSIHIGYDDKKKQFAKPYHINSDGTPGGRIQGVTPVTYKPGFRHMAAWEALDYCRQRDLLGRGDGAYGRERHQRQFLKAVIKQAAGKGLRDPVKLSKVMSAAGKALDFDGRKVSLENWLFTLKGIDHNNLVMISTNKGTYNSRIVDGQSVEELSPESRELLQKIKEDKVHEFVVGHPDWVSKDS